MEIDDKEERKRDDVTERVFGWMGYDTHRSGKVHRKVLLTISPTHEW